MKAKFDILEREKLLELSQKTLWSDMGSPALEYLKDRQIKSETAKQFQLGFVPAHAKHQLANRLIFPIFDASSNLISLSSRSIGGKSQLPSYWHERYNKSFYLYGLNLSKQRIREVGFCVVCEGNFDVIQCHDNGLTNVVGLLGSSIGEAQLANILRYCEIIIFVFDHDENRAGQKAGEKAKQYSSQFSCKLNPLQEHGFVSKIDFFSIGVAQLPEKDPDEYIKDHGIVAFKRIVKKELDKIRN